MHSDRVSDSTAGSTTVNRSWQFGLVAAGACSVLLTGCAREAFSSPSHASTARAVSTARPMQPLDIAALGDSVPAGTGAQSFVTMVGHALADQDHRRLVLDNEAISGLDSAYVLKQLTQPEVKRAVRAADITLIEVGANDFDEASASDPSCAPVRTAGCYATDMETFRTNLTTILGEVTSLRKAGSRIVVIGYWNDFADGAAGAAKGSGYLTQGRDLTQWTNNTIQSVAASQGASYADVFTPFFASGNLTPDLQADGEHPDDAGHRIIANAVLKALGSSAHV